MFFLSIPGLFRTILIIIAVIVIVRFIGRIMSAKRELDLERKLDQERKNQHRAKQDSERQKGKVSLSRTTKDEAEDVDFEEIKD